MKRILFSLMLLLGWGTAWGQPINNPTINYQGRAQDADGNAVTGPHQVTLTIYNAATGGAPLFTETHSSINFSDAGIFTVVIGGATPSGIPRSVEFSQPRWLGVTISGFNGGNELPRLRFHGSPFSTVANRADSSRSAGVADRAANADRADRAVQADSSRAAGTAAFATEAGHAATASMAESAAGLEVPLTLAGDGDQPTLTVRNAKKDATGLLVEGDLQVKGDINASGVCGTTEHFLVANDLGNTGVPARGGLYRDNTPIAWGQILPDGTPVADFGIRQVSYSPNNPGVYLVELEQDVVIDANTRPGFAISVLPMMTGQGGAQPVIAGWDYAIDRDTNLPRGDAFNVHIRNLDTGVAGQFSVIVFGRPAP